MKKKKLLLPLIVAAVLALITAGIISAIGKSQEKTVRVIPVGSVNFGGGLFSSSIMMDGNVTADASQDIYISSTQTVDEVFVTEGQRVHVGDKLLTYDTMKTSLNVAKERINKEQIELRIDVAKRNLATLKNLKPVSETIEPTEEPEEEEPEEEEWPEEEPYEEEEEPEVTPTTPAATPTKAPVYDTTVLYEVLDDSANAFNAAEADVGSRENPYRFLCTDGTEIRGTFLAMMRAMAEQAGKPVYFSLEIYEADNAANTLLASWTMNAAWLDRVEENWSRFLHLYPVLPAPAEPTVTPAEEMPYVTAAPTPIPTATPLPGHGEEDEDVPDGPEEEPEVLPAETETPAPTEGAAPEDVGEAAWEDSGSAEKPSATSPSADAAVRNMSTDAGSEAYLPDLTADAMIVSASERGYVYLANEENSANASPIAGALGLIESDAQMTKEEISAMIKSEEANLVSLRLDLRESLLDIKAAEAAVSEGTVLAYMNGIVKKVGNKDQVNNDGTPFLMVTSEDGLYVKTYITEKLYGKVRPGDTIDVMSWDSGQSFTCRVRDISIYPDTGPNSGENPTSSRYPMTATFTAGSGEAKNGEWVMVTIDPSKLSGGESMTDSMGMMFLYEAFVREEDGRYYVMKRGGDGLLVKQFIEIGRISGDGYEILSGLTLDDYVAFPYGKEVKEGAKTREGTYEELYNS